jgi:ribose transport system permease protein
MINRRKSLLEFASGQLGPVLALLFIVLFFTAADYLNAVSNSREANFASWRNIRVLSNSASLIAVPALGMTMIIIAGGIDLSAGTALTLCGTVLVKLLATQTETNVDEGFTLAVSKAIAITMLTGGLCGLINGAIISATQVVPFIVTLGTMTIFLGVGQIISNESTVSASSDRIPYWIQNLCFAGSNESKYLIIPYLPTSTILSLLLALTVGLLLRFTIFGRNLFAIGSNRSTARLCGVPIAATIISVYTLAGLVFAIGGLLYYAEVKNGNPQDGAGKELEVIAAVVLGGGSLSGGRGSVIGTLIGALIIVVIRSGCTQLNIPNTYTHIIIGIIIIVAVIVDQLRHGSPEWLFRMLPQTKNTEQSST